MRRERFILVAVAIALCTACATPTGYRGLSSGIIATPGLTIVAEDGSFTLTAGKDFAPPFINREVNFKTSIALLGNSTRTASSAWLGALDLGARRVKVRTPVGEYFGVLYFAPVPTNATGPSAANYRIDVPPRTLAAAQNGRIAWVFEYWKVGSAMRPTWILWLSDTKF